MRGWILRKSSCVSCAEDRWKWRGGRSCSTTLCPLSFVSEGRVHVARRRSVLKVPFLDEMISHGTGYEEMSICRVPKGRFEPNLELYHMQGRVEKRRRHLYSQCLARGFSMLCVRLRKVRSTNARRTLDRISDDFQAKDCRRSFGGEIRRG